MPWVAFYVAIAVLGLVILGLLTFRLYRQVRQFARDVGAAGERIAAASANLDQLGAERRANQR
jgi:DNA anti-recombination protein RmuC